ncbi:NADH:flavin oxidoreductase/NADH oxidase [Protaetiibacter intestinalis]|uniref:NADH:flavin oxidoreductase/NADH oxidase n=1 Tax=Protaetiibacter intestinalis TaxID=2419774 RepID=A0A387BCY0_9MICO|nr:NADH:flavin oxidoreductase/NADH oxidase [Protaetiibacter intestinalis]AYF98739.1 NADH:flavin oxidoreductase/NADH oxidase [Protaetiibacter intestinalis]
MPGLFDPLTLRGTTFRNRLWVAPMCQYSVPARDGVPTDWHLVHLGSLARGGSGLVIAEATAVAPEGRISPEDTGLWNEAQEAAWSRIADFVRGQGAIPGIQLAHAGRKASTFSVWGDERDGSVPFDEGGWQTLAPSAIAFEGYAEPRALELAELPDVVRAFADAAVRAVRAGFGLVEVHAAHGYLLHQFLSPLSNRRDDAYGGPLEHRARLLLEVVRAVREAVGPELPVLVRFSATDWVEDGWDPEQTATVAAWAREAGADLFDISSGGLVAGARIPLGPGYQVHLAESVGEDAEVPVAAVGLITTPAQADAVIREGRADAVLLGRELLRDPHFPLRAAHELGVDLPYWPPQYLRARWR